MLRMIASLMPDDLVILLCILVGTILYLFAIATICRCLFAFVEEASGPDSRRAPAHRHGRKVGGYIRAWTDSRRARAHRRREDLRRALGRG